MGIQIVIAKVFSVIGCSSSYSTCHMARNFKDWHIKVSFLKWREKFIRKGSIDDSKHSYPLTMSQPTQ